VPDLLRFFRTNITAFCPWDTHFRNTRIVK
jgi:hypothetical protein